MQAGDLLGVVHSALQKALARAVDVQHPLASGDVVRLASTIRIMEALLKARCCARSGPTPRHGSPLCSCKNMQMTQH